MFKYVFMALTLFMSANAYAQDMMASTNAVKRSLTVYLDGGTGNVNTDAARNAGSDLLNSWYETGVVVSQNFAEAQWLRLDLTAAIEGGVSGLLLDNNGNFVGSPSATGTITGFGKVNLGLTKYVNIGLHTAGRLDMELKYNVSLPANQTMGFSFYTELFPTGNALYTIFDQNSGSFIPDGTRTRQVLAFLQLRMFYEVGFARDWSFATDLRFRFDGKSPNPTVRGDSLEAVRQSFNVRWNNTLAYTNPNGFGGYVQLRYNAKQLTKVGVKQQHEVEIVTGVAYSYDMSAL